MYNEVSDKSNLEGPIMFPEKLDGADVLYYTAKGVFETVFYTTGEVFDHVKYFAICRYVNEENRYYLFGCNDNYDVICDSVWDSIAECMRSVNFSCSCNIRWIKAKL